MLSPERASVLKPAVFMKSRLEIPRVLFLDISPLLFISFGPPFLSSPYYDKIKIEKTVGNEDLELT
jgi:hypothetical protein